MERIDKILSNCAGLSRTDAKQYIKKGRIRVNGSVINDAGFKADEKDIVELDGKPLNISRFRYFMLNKPSGYISSTKPEPEDDSPNIISLFKSEGVRGLFPVGRLDKDATGLLLVTNDGELGHRLTSPEKHVDKIYLAKVRGQLTEKDVLEFAKGFEFKEFISRPAKLEILSNDLFPSCSEIMNDDSEENDGYSLAKVTISEGKFHQVKRMFQKVGCEVVELKRIQMGCLILDENLKAGEYRELNQEELQGLLRAEEGKTQEY